MRLEPYGAWGAGLTEAIKLRDQAEARKPGPEDAPEPSTFPTTAAARAALRYDAQRGIGISPKRRRELTYGDEAAVLWLRLDRGGKITISKSRRKELTYGLAHKAKR